MITLQAEPQAVAALEKMLRKYRDTSDIRAKATQMHAMRTLIADMPKDAVKGKWQGIDALDQDLALWRASRSTT